MAKPKRIPRPLKTSKDICQKFKALEDQTKDFLRGSTNYLTIGEKEVLRIVIDYLHSYGEEP